MILIKALKLLKRKDITKLDFIKKQKKSLLNIVKSDNNSKFTRIRIKNNPSSLKQFQNNQIFKQNLINYIIKFNVTLTNTFINVTDIKGNSKLSLSAGKLNLTKKQKIVQPNVLIQMLKTLFLKAKFLQNKTVGLQFHNTKTYHELLIINNIKNKIFIKSLRSYNLYPHNGCRPKKIKRFKRRTKRLQR